VNPGLGLVDRASARAKGQVYTPDALALAICKRLAEFGHNPEIIIEPSVGGGAFVRAARAVWPHARIFACDIDPNAAGLALADRAMVGDWLEFTTQLALFPEQGTVSRDRVLVLGNPPYTRGTGRKGKRGEIVETVIGQHIEASQRVGRVAFLLPAATIFSGKNTGEYRVMREGWVIHPVNRRPWASSREVAVYESPRLFSSATIQPPIDWR
jgi:hypothetical protein